MTDAQEQYVEVIDKQIVKVRDKSFGIIVRKHLLFHEVIVRQAKPRREFVTTGTESEVLNMKKKGLKSLLRGRV